LQDKGIFEFGPYRLDCAERLLSKSGTRVPLAPKAFDTLSVLVCAHGQLQDKDQLLNAIWPDTFVEEGNLALNISQLRKALDDGGPYIETVPKRGYRFVAEVRTPEAAAPPPAAVRRRWPIAAALLVLVAITTWLLWPKPRIKSLAVMPFVNYTGDPANEYFADGFTEEVIDRFANVPGLRVISRTSAFTFKNKPVDVREIGRRLGVELVLEGSIRRSANEWRITAQLIDAKDGAHLWSRTWDRSMQDIFVVQDDLSREIAASFQLPSVEPAEMRLDPRAHDLAMQARFQLGLRNRDGLARGRDLIRQALEIDPRYARGYAMLAEYHHVAAEVGLELPAEAHKATLEAAQKAVALDDRLAIGHVRLGVAKLDYEWNWDAAEREFRRAIEVEPGSAGGHSRYGILLMQRGRVNEGLAEVRRALQLDPVAPAMNSDVAMALYMARRFDEAVAQANRAVELAPNSVAPYYRRGWANAVKGDCRAALADADRMQEHGAGPNIVLPLRGYCDHERAPEYLRQLESMRKPGDRLPWSFALIWCGLGNHDKFFEEWDRALDLPDSYMIYVPADPVADPMRSDPRFAARLKRLGL
jgi:TolB-like protein/DNA-binding winged helix-turn-helix (wHTH) protein/Tfp pilus assembly protein PilF